ncbi:MAG: deoxyribose-phosphate aldolase [Dehalobacterium sp.]
MITYQEIAGMIDHALLKPNLTDEEIIEGCKVAIKYGVASVCVRPSDVRLAHEILKNSQVLVTTVIGFPHGTTTTLCKVAEAQEAMANGAVELDVVLNVGKMKSGAYGYVQEDLKAVIDAAHKKKAIVKVIFENCYLTDEEKIEACRICNEIGADFAKTSTGFGTGGAKDDDLILMRKHCSPRIQIKAAGGIRTLEQAIRVKELGCSRFGCSATAEILKQIK